MKFARYKKADLLFRCLLQQHVSTKDFCLETLNKSRQDLQKSIDQWHIHHRKLFPLTPPHPQADHPENEKLELPSSFNAGCFQPFGISILARLEYDIRLGHAYDAIDDIRSAIHIYNPSSHEKRKQMFSQRSTTRAWAVLNSLKDNIRDCAKRYHLSFSVLLVLGLPQGSELKPIRDHDLWGKDLTSVSKQGDSKRKEPWYWVIGKPKDLSDNAWELECASSLHKLTVPFLTPVKWNVFTGFVCELPAIVFKRKLRYLMKSFNARTPYSPK